MNKLKEQKRIRNEKDKAWAIAIKERDGFKCVACSSKEKLNAHHIIPRSNRLMRWEICNGITCCPKHHRFSFEMSAHQNPFVFYLWFIQNRKEQFDELLIKVKDLGLLYYEK